MFYLIFVDDSFECRFIKYLSTVSSVCDSMLRSGCEDEYPLYLI